MILSDQEVADRLRTVRRLRAEYRRINYRTPSGRARAEEIGERLRTLTEPLWRVELGTAEPSPGGVGAEHLGFCCWATRDEIWDWRMNGQSVTVHERWPVAQWRSGSRKGGRTGLEALDRWLRLPPEPEAAESILALLARNTVDRNGMRRWEAIYRQAAGDSGPVAERARDAADRILRDGELRWLFRDRASRAALLAYL